MTPTCSRHAHFATHTNVNLKFLIVTQAQLAVLSSCNIVCTHKTDAVHEGSGTVRAQAEPRLVTVMHPFTDRWSQISKGDDHMLLARDVQSSRFAWQKDSIGKRNRFSYCILLPGEVRILNMDLYSISPHGTAFVPADIPFLYANSSHHDPQMHKLMTSFCEFALCSPITMRISSSCASFALFDRL